MSNLLRSAAIVAAFFVAGCAISPLPENVTGLDTYTIVRKIRCEARDAVKRKVIVYLKALGDPDLERMGLEFEAGTRPISTFSYNQLPRGVREVVKLFYDTAIGYNFTFDITEVNNLDATINLLKPIQTTSIGSLGISTGFDRQRQNTRTFTITDTFSFLMKNVPEQYCTGIYATLDKNYIYPITGRIGIDEMVDTFVDLTLFANLSGADNKGPPTIGDTKAFQTLLTGSATPRIEFLPLSSNASLTGLASRKDAHQVIVALALSPGASKDVVATRGALIGQLTTGQLVTAQTGSSSERLAVETIEQIIRRQILTRSPFLVVQ
jgi:hypothetical protein